MAVAISVAMVMPEMGLEEEPIRPTMREETVTKMKPKTMTRTATSSRLRKELPGMKGRATSTNTRARLPAMTVTKERSRSVRRMLAAAVLSESERIESRSDE
jgi:hypothetical protein